MNTKLISFGLALFLGFNLIAQKKEVKNAEKAMKKNNFSEAIKEIEKAESLGILEEKDKWVVRYYLAKGDVLFGPLEKPLDDLETLEKSAKAYQKALEIDESNKDALQGFQEVRKQMVNSAVVDQKNDNYKVAKEKLYKSYLLDKKDTIYLFYAAGSAINAGDFRDAVNFYEKLLQIGYDGSRMEYYAVNNETKERESFGDKDYRDLMVKTGEYTNPEDVKTPSVKAEIAKNTSSLYIQLEESEKAMEAIQIAKDIDPDDITLIQAEADLYYQLGDLEKYQELMNLVKEKAPDDPQVYYNLGVSAEQLEDQNAAKDFYEKAVELDPEMINAYVNLASVILSKERPIIDQMNELGMSAADNKKYDELNKEKQEIYEEAKPHLLEALKLDASNKGIIQTLMNIYYQTGEDEKAKQMKIRLDELE